MPLTFEQLSTLWAKKFSNKAIENCLYVNVKEQKMDHFLQGELMHSYVVSTAKNGLGNKQGSYQTPFGFHKIGEKIGAGQPKNMLFKAREATGDIAVIDNLKWVQQDTITSRILWLDGLEKGMNLAGNVDSKQRYIYIHGTADEAHLGQAVSHGCIRMKNTDIIELFNLVDEHTIVYMA